MLIAGPLLDRAGGLGGGPVDADAGELALRVGDLLGAVPEQRQRGAPGEDPAEVGREVAAALDVEGAGQVAAGEGGAAAQVDDPLAGFDAAPQLSRVGRAGDFVPKQTNNRRECA